MVDHEKKNAALTRHALHRMKERKIPKELVELAISCGRKAILLDRKANEYTLKNVLGVRGVNLVVIQSFDGAIITSYAEKSGSRRP